MLTGYLTSYAFWLLLGLALLLSEFFIPAMVAVFFGIGALVVGLLTLFGVIDTLPSQLLLFSLISLIALWYLRRHFTRWLRGSEADLAARDQDDAGLLGARVTVLTDFAQGIGDVQLNGAKWDAESSEPLKAGDTAWVLNHSGIVLQVSAQRPSQP
ncbi:NfeD family protein [Halopseudomonas sp.]|uniref:NfeD family protein n=1 Tax=Halopseudomonas sp. TaxID=2901191 RepID=UPI0030016927